MFIATDSRAPAKLRQERQARLRNEVGAGGSVAMPLLTELVSDRTARAINMSLLAELAEAQAGGRLNIACGRSGSGW